MDIKELKELIDATIYPNGEKKIKASSHQSTLHEIVDYTDENITTINEGLEEVKNTLETQGNDVAEQLKESSKRAELNDAKVNQKIDNLASNIVGLGGDIKGSAKGVDVIGLPNVAINGVAPGYTIGGLTDTEKVKSVKLPMRVTSVGANLWKHSEAKVGKGNIKTETGFIKPVGVYAECELILKLQPNTEYILGCKMDGQVRSIVRNIDIGETILGLASSEIRRFNSKDGGMFKIKFDTSSSELQTNAELKNIYISTTKQYTPYTESTGYIISDTELRSLPKIKDYVKNDKLYKNIARYYFTKEDNWALRDDYEGDNFRYYMTLPFEYKTSGSGVEGELFCNNYTATSNVASVLTERDSNTIALYRENSSTIYLTLDKKVDNVNSIIPEGTFVDVILLKTEQVKLDTSGVVTTKPNGTIFIENIKNVTDFYAVNGLEVKDFKELVSIYKYEGSDLVQLDASKAVFTTTLKHPDLTDGDLVFFEYKYLDSPIWGDNEIEYFNKNNVLQSENGKLWQKVEKASNEGVLTTELKEIV